MKFSEVTGHGKLKDMLRRAVDEGRVSHAQLFSGEAGNGGLPLALAYAQYVNCTGRRDGDSCGECASCRKIGALAHPDLHFVFPVKGSGGEKSMTDTFLPQWRDTVARTGGYFDEAGWYEAIEMGNQQGLISQADADEVIRKLSFKSFEAAYKVMVIWLPEKMKEGAANTLLKILEEPWPGTLFLLVSQAPERLLSTILSRTQEVTVPRIDTPELTAWLQEAHGLAVEQAAQRARLAGGNRIAARRLAEGDGEDAGNFFQLFMELMRLSYNDKHLELLEWSEGVAALGREEQKRLLAYFVSMLRSSYMISAGLEDLSYLWGEELKFCRNFAPFIGNHNIEALVAEMETASLHVARNGNPRMIFAHFALVVSKLIVRK